MKNIDAAIIAILLKYGVTRSVQIAEYLVLLGFWFVEARCWPALRRLERAGVIVRSDSPVDAITKLARGDHPAYAFALKAPPRPTHTCEACNAPFYDDGEPAFDDHPGARERAYAAAKARE